MQFNKLTLETPSGILEAQKIAILCEDDLAISYLKKLIKKSEILKLVSFHSNLNNDTVNNGTSYTSLSNLCKNFPLLLQNSIVVFDADVDDAVTKKINDKTTYLLLPDEEKLAIERRIVCFILELDGDDQFFHKFNEKHWFEDQFKQAGIESLTPADVKNEKVVSITSCKAWANINLSEFKKYLTYYSSKLKNREDFIKLFIQRINLINKRKGLPLLSE